MSERFIYCFQQKNPKTLIMLRKCEKIVEQMARSDNTMFIWIDQQLTKQGQVRIKKISKQSEISIKIYRKLEQCLFDVHNQLNKLFIIICSPKILKEAQKFKRKLNVLNIICYPMLKQKKLKQQFIFYTAISNEQELLQELKMHKQRKFQYKELQCFLSINDNIQYSNTQMRTMFAMLNQTITTGVRCLIVDQLQALLTKLKHLCLQIHFFSQVSSAFLQQIRQGQMSFQRAIFWYTRQSPIYKLTNNILRSSNHPCQSFYIQPFFKDLFKAVEKLYYIQRKDKLFQQFTCYRGGTISEKQISYFSNNVGGIVQNTSFLSASLVKETGQMFLSNALFIIIVRNMPTIREGDYGYAFLEQYSEYNSESQILFNPLNSFKVINVSERTLNQQCFYQIILEYGVIPKKLLINSKQQNQLQLVEGYFYKNKQINLQGDALYFVNTHLEGSQQYWSKFLEIAQKQQEKLRALTLLSNLYYNKGNFSKAVEFAKFDLPIIDKQNYGNINEYLQRLNNLAIIFSLQKNFIQAFQLYKKCKQIFQDNRLKKSLNYAQILNNQGACYFQYGNLNQALQLYEESKSLMDIMQQNKTSLYLANLINISWIHIRKGEYLKAQLLLDNAQKFFILIFGHKNINIQAILFAKMYVFLQLKKFQQTFKILKKFVQIVKNFIKINHSFHIKKLAIIGGVYFSLYKVQKALKIFENCKKNMKKNKEINKTEKLINNLCIKLCLSNLKQKQKKKKNNLGLSFIDLCFS